MEATQAKMDLSMRLESNPSNVEYGTLANGFQYYIRSNANPSSTVFVTLVVRAGSVLELPHESGVAHLIEHLVFTATDGYKNGDGITYLEHLKTLAGPCTYAKTYHDFVSYAFSVQKQDLSHMIAALADMSSEVKVAEETLDRERLVVMSELKGKSEDGNYLETKAFNSLKYEGCKYAEPIIGYPEAIQTVSVETVNHFYEKWYRSENMSILIFGDFDDTQGVIELVKYHFESKFSVLEPQSIPKVTLPTYVKPRLFCHVHSAFGENSDSHVSIAYRISQTPRKTLRDFYDSWVESIFTIALQNRLDKISCNGDSIDCDGMTDFLPVRVYAVTADCSFGRATEVLKAILIEVARIRLHGFDDEEIYEARASLLEKKESSSLNHDKVDSRHLLAAYSHHFLFGDAILNVDYMARIQKSLIPQISPAEVSCFSENLRTSANCSIMTTEPQPYTTVSDLENVVQSINVLEEVREIPKWVCEQTERFEYTIETVSGNILEQFNCPNIGAVEVVLSNGMRVTYKCTNVDDQVCIEGFSYGGLAEVSDSDYLSCSMACGIACMSGICGFDQLQGDGSEVLAGVLIDKYQRAFQLSFPPSDIEAALQRTYLLFTSDHEPTEDILQLVMARVESNLKSKGQTPYMSLRNHVEELNGCGSYFFKSLSVEDLSKVDSLKACQYFNECYRDPSNFVVVIVGKIDPVAALPFILKYLGGIPQPREPLFYFPRHSLTVVPYSFPATTVRKEILELKIGSQCEVGLSFPLFLKNESMDEEIWVAYFLMNLLKSRALKRLRYNLGEVYYVGGYLLNNDDTYSVEGDTCCGILIEFRSPEAKYWQLVDILLDEIALLQSGGPSETDIVAALETLEFEKSNNQWPSLIKRCYKSRKYVGDLNYAYEALNKMDKKLAHSMNEVVAKRALQTMLPFPCKDRYIAVVLKPKQ